VVPVANGFGFAAGGVFEINKVRKRFMGMAQKRRIASQQRKSKFSGSYNEMKKILYKNFEI
jgi:hypothetical protein